MDKTPNWHYSFKERRMATDENYYHRRIAAAFVAGILLGITATVICGALLIGIVNHG